MKLTGAESITDGIRQAAPFQVNLHFEALADIPAAFKRDLLVSLGDCDIARISVELSGLQPGTVAVQTFDLYAPRNIPSGSTELRVGFLKDGAPGEMKREDWTFRRARALTLDVAAAFSPEDLTAAEKEALLSSRSTNNLLRNGGFDDGWEGWRVDEDIRKGKGGWGRLVSLQLDREVSLSPPFSLRVDFAGGQDPNFYSPDCDAEVKPNTAYTLSYFIKTENITSGGAPCLDVADPDHSFDYFYAVPFPEQRLTGTHAWTPISFGFKTPADTTRVRIKVRRHGSGSSAYEPSRWGPIGGTAWFDAVRLVEGAP